MTDVAVGFLLCLMALAAIGVGPSLWLVSGTDRGGVALAICPVVGLVLVSVVGTSLTMLDWPVSRWATPALVVGVFISIVLSLRSTRCDTGTLIAANRRVLLPFAAFVSAGVLAMAPQIVGGLQFSILRGDGTDSFNYVASAGALDHESLSWLAATDPQSLVDRHQSYVRVHALLETRWATMMMLAFSSRMAGIAPYRFEYAFSVLCLLLTFGPAFLWCNRLMDVAPWSAALTAAIISAGFWGQFVLDERADAHQNVIPVLLLFSFLVARIEMFEGHRMRWGEHVLLGLTGASLLLTYPEIAPMTLLGLAIFLGIRVLRAGTSGVRLTGWAFSACLAVMATFPLRNLLIHFAERQLNYATAGVNTWHLAYFRWLYSSPLTGLWGFGPLVAGDTSGAYAFRLVLLPLGAILTIALAAAIVHAASVAAKYPGMTLCSTLAAATLLQWGYLYSRGQLWAGGKGLSFGYPFLIMSVVGYGLSRAPSHFKGWHAQWRTGVTTCVTAFLLVQGGLAFYRPWLAARGTDYVGYIDGHGEYRQHDWDLTPFERVLTSQRGLTVWSDVSNPWVADYIGLVLGWEVHLVNLRPGLDQVEMQAPPQHRDRPPDYLIVENVSSDAASRQNGGAVVAQTGELSLLRVENSPTLTSIQNPNGLEGNPDAPFFWLGGEPTILNVVAPSDGCALFRARFAPGPSGPDRPYRRLTLTTTVDAAPDVVLIQGGPQEIRFRMTSGVNQVQLHVDEAVILSLAGDKRPLLLRVDDLRVEGVPCQIGGR